MSEGERSPTAAARLLSSRNDSADRTSDPLEAHLGTRASITEVSPATSSNGGSVMGDASAEQALDTSLFVAPGDTHIRLSRDEIQCIRDPDLLHFLEENTTLRRSHRGNQPDMPMAASAGSRFPPSRTEPEVESTLRDLQREIDVFLTAVDHNGYTYRICLDEDGNAVVPLEDDELNGEPSPSDDMGSEKAVNTLSGEPDISLHTSFEAAVDSDERENPQNEDGALKATPAPESRHGRPSKSSTTFKGKQHGAGSSKGRPRPQKKATVGPLSTSGEPTLPVKPIRALSAGEEIRVQLLLQDDTSRARLEDRPFSFSADVRERLKELDTQLGRFRVARGMALESSLLHEPPTHGEVAEASRPDGRTKTAMTSNELGNAYMRQAREDVLRRQRLEAIHKRLRQLHREEEEMNLLPSTGTPESVLQFRPEWAKEGVATVSSETVQQMLAAAAEEAQRAEANGLRMALPAPPLQTTPFLQNMREVQARALRLVAEMERHPLLPYTSGKSADGAHIMAWEGTEEQGSLSEPME